MGLGVCLFIDVGALFDPILRVLSRCRRTLWTSYILFSPYRDMRPWRYFIFLFLVMLALTSLTRSEDHGLRVAQPLFLGDCYRGIAGLYESGNFFLRIELDRSVHCRATQAQPDQLVLNFCGLQPGATLQPYESFIFQTAPSTSLSVRVIVAL